MPDEIATVGLELDADDFDEVASGVFDSLAALGETTAAIMRDAGVTVDSVLSAPLGKLSEKVKAVTDGLAKSTTGLAEKLSAGFRGLQNTASMLLDESFDKLDAGAINEQVLADLGGMIGSKVGGPAGSVIGQLIGEGLADVVPVDELLESVQEIADAASESFGGVGTFWANTQQDMRDFFGETKDAFRGLNIGELLSGDLDTGLANLDDFAAGILDSVGEKVELLVGRVANGMDNLFKAVQEPFAKILDWIEKVFVKVGVLPKATGEWGAAVRSVGSIATEVFRAIGFGIGFLEGLFTKLGGYVGEYVIGPMLAGVGKILSFAQDAFALIAKNVGGAVGRAAKDTGDVLKILADDLKREQAAFDKLAEKASGTEVFGKGKEWGDAFAGALDGFKQKAKEADEIIAELRKRQAQWLTETVGGIFARTKAELNDFWTTIKSFAPSSVLPAVAPTAYEGSGEAGGAISQFRSQNESVGDQTRRLAEKQAQEAEAGRKAAEEANKKLDELIRILKRQDAL